MRISWWYKALTNFKEGENGGRMFFIVQGKVAIIHRETKSYIRDLTVLLFLTL
jgi:hypothetical protein